MALGIIVAPNTTPIKASAIQAPSASGANTKQVLSQLKEGMEIAQRLRGSVGDSYVRVSELVALGLGTIVNGNLQLSNGGVVGGGGTPPSTGGGSSGGPGATGATGAQGPQGAPGEDGHDGEDGLTIVGPPGPIGAQGDHAPIFWPDDPEDPQIIPGPAGASGADGAQGPAGVSGFPIFIEPDDPDDAQVVPGPPGAAGADGASGPAGASGFPIYVEPQDPDDPLVVPGPAGPAGSPGSPGSPGATGPAGFPIFIEPEDPEDPQVIPGPPGAASSLATPQMRGASFSGGTLAITVPTNNVPIYVPFDCTITNATLLTQGGPGSCQLDIWKVPYASYPPTPIDSIVALAPPKITSGAEYTDSTLTGWTTSLSAGDTLLVSLTSTSEFTAISLFLTLTPVGFLNTGYTNADAVAAVVAAGIISSGSGNGYCTSEDWDYPEELPWRDVPQNCDVNVWSATQYFTPAAGVAVQIQGISGQNAAVITGGSTTGESNGLIIVAGTNSSDNALHVYNQAGSETFLQLNGDGSGILGYNSSSRTTLQFTAAGEVEISGSLVVLNASGSTTIFEATSATAPTVQGYGPTVAALVDMTPDTGTFTITYTGMTTSITGTAIWARIGNLVTLFFPAATGTSNSTSMTATGMPTAIKPARAQAIPIPGFSLESAGAIPLTDSNDISIATSGTVTFYLNGSATGFGSTVNKGVATAFTVSYLLN